MNVLDIQTSLRSLGFDPGALDGQTGPKTTAAIKAFQKQHGLVVDGVVGQKTEAALMDRSPIPAAQPSPAGSPRPSGLAPDLIAGAQAAQKAWNIPASVSLAQFGLESAWGTKMPAGSMNPFGIKAAAGQPFVIAHTREVVHGQSIYIDAKFRKFANFAEAFDAHGRLIGTLHVYAPALHVWETTHDVDAFVRVLGPIYATDPLYHNLIMSIIRSKNLTQYDA